MSAAAVGVVTRSPDMLEGLRERVWKSAGNVAPDVGGRVALDIDGVLVLAYSEKQDAVASWKKTFGHHPLARLLKLRRRGRRTLIRTDSAGGTHEFVNWLTRRGRQWSHSAGMVIADAVPQAVLLVPAWTPAIEPDGDVCDVAWVAEIPGDVLKGRLPGMRMIVRKERPHPGARLRIIDADGMRLTRFVTNAAGDPIVQLLLDLLAWTRMLALTGEARRWEPKRLRLR